MKLKTTLIVVALAFAQLATGQTYYKSSKDGKPVTKTSRWTDYARQQYYSIRFGLNAATGWFNHNKISHVETEGRTGFSVELMYGKQLTSPDVPLFIEFGVGYSQKGFRSNFIENGSAYSYRHNMNFLEIPLDIKYKIKTGVDDFTVQPFVGAFVDWGLSSDTFIYEHPERKRTKTSTFGDEIFSRVDAGVRVGCGLAFQNFYIEARYDFGLVDICSDHIKKYYPMYEGFDENGRNGCFSLSIGVEF